MANRLLASDIRGVFEGEVTALGGAVSDTYEDGPLLLARSIMPGVEEVRPGDRLRGGVAIRAIEDEVFVHPYVFRQVCTNGCIAAQALETRHFVLDDFGADEEVVREAIRACAAPEAFADVAGRMRSATEAQADLSLNLLPHLRRFPQAARFLGEIIRRFEREGDRSTFGLVNAVTSTARDTPDPRARWELESAGGALLWAAPEAAAPAFERAVAEPCATA
jgi:hypothetical protein